MNYVCIRSLSDKENILPPDVFNKKLKTADKNGSVSRSTAHRLNHYSERDEQHKIKRLKSRRERSQMRMKEASKYKSHQHHCRSKISKDLAHVHNCCHSSCHCPSRRDVLFPNVVPAAQEPSIITDSRLTGHQGLFNHEVKSIAIERLLNKQKLEKRGQQVQEESNATSRLSSTPPVASPLSVNDLLGADTDEVMPFEKKADPATKTHDDCQDEAKKISQGSDITPGQRPQPQLVLSSGNIASFKRTSVDAAVSSKKTNPGMSEKRREAQVTPTVDRKHVKTLNKRVKGNINSTLEHTPKNQKPPVHQPHGLNTTPLKLSSSHTADSFDIQYRRRDPNSVSKSVSTVAARLCDTLQFPLLTRRSLVAESREVLLKALREWHGPQLQEDLLEVQRCLSFGTDRTKEVQNQEPTMVEKDELLHADAFPTVFQAITARPSRFDMQETTALKITRNRHFNSKSSPQLHHNLNQTAEWLKSPVEPSVGLLDDVLRPTRSPQLCMDFESSGVTAINHLFAPSPTSCWAEEASASPHWGDIFNRPKSKEAVMFGSFENNYINHRRAVTERSRGSQYNNDNVQPHFFYQAQLPDRHTAQPVHFPQERGRFETDRYSLAPSFSAQSHYPQQHNNFQPFSHFSHSSSRPPLRSHHTDMMHYPPSHMLERDPAPPLSSFSSPEPWSFPPMRLY
ncbi:hypothetical protein D9C73_016408 [Collichthys lucidus]|uniref:Uncharacterized protein n=1 Tax=Collichthys lucidus TaxID=240159 RepID=A0A4U5V3Y4_COLLU|nr:hypothetical protein D9C73_016408 [Collichthys lucidus]